MSPRPQPKMAEPKAEKRGTLRGPPLFRMPGDGHKGHKSPTHVVALFAVAARGIRGFLASATTTVRRVEALTVAPLMAVRTKEIGMHDIYDPQRTRKCIATKHQARGFMVGPVGFMMNERIH